MLLLPLYENISIPGNLKSTEYLKNFKYYIHILWIQSNAKIQEKVDEYITYKYGIDCRIMNHMNIRKDRQND